MENTMENATQEGASIQERIQAVLDKPLENPESQPIVEAQAEPEAEDVEEVKPAEDAPDSTENTDISAEEDEEAEGQDAETEGESLSLSDIAQILGIDEDRLDVDEDGKVIAKTKVDGQEGKAKLADLIKSYQLEGHLNKQNMEVAEAKKALQEQKAQLEQAQQEKIEQLDNLVNLAWTELNREFNEVDWRSLREDDPAEFAAKRAEFQERERNLQGMYREVEQDKQKQQQTAQERYQEHVAKEAEQLYSAIPEWKDQAVASKEMDTIRSYAKSIGFTDENLDQVADHRVVLALRDAARYRNLQTTKPAIDKKVKKAPKIAKPGQAPSKSDQESQKLKDLRAAVKKTGGKGDTVVDYLLSSGKI